MGEGLDQEGMIIGVSDFFYPTNPQKVFTGDGLPNPCWVVRDAKGKLLVAREIGREEFLACVFSSEALGKGFLVTSGFLETMEVVVLSVGDIVVELEGYVKVCINPLSKKSWDQIIELRR